MHKQQNLSIERDAGDLTQDKTAIFGSFERELIGLLRKTHSSLKTLNEIDKLIDKYRGAKK